MATPIDIVKVGDIVYKAFEPRNPGVVIEAKQREIEHVGFLSPRKDLLNSVKIKWSNGKITDEAYYGYISPFNDFKALIEETERKLNSHRSKLKKLIGE